MNSFAKKFFSLSLLIIGLISLIMIYNTLFEKHKDVYLIKGIDIKLVKLVNTKISELNSSDKLFERIGVSFTLKKEYYSNTNSKRYLLGGSMENGLLGHNDSISFINVSSNSFIFNKELISYNYLNKSEDEIGTDIYNLYTREINLSDFINDLIRNKKYTKGESFDDGEIYFWISKKYEKSFLENKDSILLSYKINNFITNKKVAD